MSRSRIVIALVACLAAGSIEVLRADVRSEEKTRFQLAGALGKVVNLFGGKAAREGVTSTVATSLWSARNAISSGVEMWRT